MTILTKEKLEEVASWAELSRSKNVTISAHVVGNIARRLMAAEAQLTASTELRQAQQEPAGWQARREGGDWFPIMDEDLDYYRDDGAEVREIYASITDVPDFRNRVRELLKIGSRAPDFSVFTGIENAIRRSECLSNIEALMSVSVIVGNDELDGSQVEISSSLLHWGEEPAKYLETFKAAAQVFFVGNASVIPEGWKLAPIAANLSMARAGAAAARKYMEETGGNSPFVINDAMIAAAPQSDHTEQPLGMVIAAVRDVIAERQRQITEEGWTPEHDNAHSSGELARAAACYAQMSVREEFLSDGEYAASQKILPFDWPWEPAWWKPSNPRRDLVKAGALILAEIERIDRCATQSEG
ncbi:hypothetical protein [Dickeya dianthicola]|uniref:hypothetical protein n=1 Tax=Dickeya dianthicola TaxID=204039 RepID=UPI001F603ABA|nr:hypothetical protein [Dickeya dianthicola]MCI4223895.1 hypothetical protein [Dickeya dianthicola]